MTAGLAGIHEMLGGLVVVALIVVVVLAAIQAAGGEGRWTRTASMIAAGLLALQYVLGVLLIGGGARNSNTHYIIALLIIIPIGLQHSSARRLSERTRGVAMVLWSLAAGFLAIIAYMTGMNGVAGG